MRLATFFDAINEDAATDMQVAQFAEVVHGIIYQYIKANGQDHNWGFVNVGDRGRTEPNYELVQNVATMISQMNAEDTLINAPDWYRPSLMSKLYVALLKEEQGIDREQGTTIKGGVGHMKKGGEPFLILFMLLSDNPNAFVDDRFNSGWKITFIHEFTHIIDEMRTQDTWKDKTPTHRAGIEGEMEAYYSHPKEFQAFYIEAVHQLVDMLKSRGEKWDTWIRGKYFGGGFDQFLAEFMKIFPEEYQLAPKFDKKLKKRIYKLYTELLDRQQQLQ